MAKKIKNPDSERNRIQQEKEEERQRKLSKSKELWKNMWRVYLIKWDFLTSLCGSTPDREEIIPIVTKVRKPSVKPAGGRPMDKINIEVIETIKDAAELGQIEEEQLTRVIFQRAPKAFDYILPNGNRKPEILKVPKGALVQRASTTKAHMKDCARAIYDHAVGRIPSERAFYTRVAQCLYPDERNYWIPILREGGSFFMDADGQIQRPIHPRDFRTGAPMSAIKCFEYVNGAHMQFAVKIMGDSIHESDLRSILTYGGVHGYAGERSAGEGKYAFQLTAIGEKKVSANKTRITR